MIRLPHFPLEAEKTLHVRDNKYSIVSEGKLHGAKKVE